MLKNKTLMFSI